MRITDVFVAVFMLTSSAIAADWQALTATEIEAALDERVVQYAGAKQHFYESGRTLYDNGRPSWGYWQVRGDQYCSQWPPADGWACYGVELGTNGHAIRFISETGSRVEGHYLE